jgi:hypothetical protein
LRGFLVTAAELHTVEVTPSYQGQAFRLSHPPIRGLGFEGRLGSDHIDGDGVVKAEG